MNKLKIKDVVYELSSCWEEVNIKNYIEIQKIIESNSTDLQRISEVISLLSGCPLDIIRQINIEDLSNIDLNWINTKIKEDISKTIVIDNVKYGVVKDLKKISLGEYADLESYIPQPVDNFHKICAILMRPVIQEDGDLYIIESYDINTVEKRANIFFEKMNVTQLYNLSNFFLGSANGLLKNMMPYSQKPLAEKKQKTKKKK